MNRSLLIVSTSPVSPETEADYNDWYDNTHLGEILANVASISHASRYDVTDRTTRPAPEGLTPLAPWKLPYAAVYEIQSEDPESVLAELRELNIKGAFTPTDALDKEVNLPHLLLLTPHDQERTVRHI